MEEEKSLDFVTEDITVSDVLPVQEDVISSVPNAEEVAIDDKSKPYDKLDKLNLALDELKNDLEAEKQVEAEIMASVNEIEMPTISNEEMNVDLNPSMPSNDEVSMDIDTNITSNEDEDFKEELTKEINVIEADENIEDVSSDAGSKGQFILIVILTLVLIALLVAMIVFTNAL